MALQQNQDRGYRDFHLKTCPNAGNLIGVRMPIQRRLAKQITKGDFRRFLSETKNEFYEETLIEGLVIATAKMELTERLRYARGFVPKIYNWAICDAFAASWKISEKDLDEVWKFLQDYRTSSYEFECRFMIVMMLDHFLRIDYLAGVLETVCTAQTEQYYVGMACAWLVAEAFTQFREPVLAILESGRLMDFIQNRAIQKIRDSYRISRADKDLVATLRRKS